MRNQSLLVVKEKLQVGSIDDYSASYVIIQGIINTPQLSKDKIAKWFRNVQDGLFSSVTNLINGIVNEVKEAAAFPNANEKIANIFMGYV